MEVEKLRLKRTTIITEVVDGVEIICSFLIYTEGHKGPAREIHCVFSREQVAESHSMVADRLAEDCDLGYFPLVSEYPGMPERSEHPLMVITGIACRFLAEFIAKAEGIRIVRQRVNVMIADDGTNPHHPM